MKSLDEAINEAITLAQETKKAQMVFQCCEEGYALSQQLPEGATLIAQVSLSMVSLTCLQK